MDRSRVDQPLAWLIALLLTGPWPPLVIAIVSLVPGLAAAFRTVRRPQQRRMSH
ncbi:MAG: hypothetical protein HWE39_21730 [Oceanospirillaceae bacterium]|nr:hypothetical protein [Oceanospirillaceae bacterium]